MKADTSPLKTIFGKEVQYVVPLYQRPYVWREETHWAPLWTDVGTVVQQILKSQESTDAEVAPHFLGAVVLDQQRGPTASIERRHVIDGQQRLTTLQLLIAAGARAAADAGFQRQSRQLNGLIANDADYVNVEYDAFKIWPTNVDRPAFQAVMSSHRADPLEHSFTLIDDAYNYFSGRFEQELAELGEGGETWLAAITDALRSHVQLVVIDLEEKDNPQVIFETLNARGTPLLAIDLVKNLLFLKTHQGGDDVEALYRDHWRKMERAYWRETIRQGRLTRPRAEVFLMHWLTMKRREETPSHQLYNAFRPLAERKGSSGSELLVELTDDAEVFSSFDSFAPGTPEHRFFSTLRVLDTRAIMPVVLALFKAPLTEADRRLALAALESWLVRRALSGLTPKNYNRFSIELLSVFDEDSTAAANLLINRLRAATADTNRWPDDKELSDALIQYRFYGRLSQALQRLVLLAIEGELRTERTEPLGPTTLTIEHVLPQKWREHWPTSPPGDPLLEAERDAHVQRLGNLTLVTGPLNIPMSNAGWEAKRPALDEHSVLLLNKQLVRDHPDTWDESAIDARSARLAEVVSRLWPGPADAWDAGALGPKLATEIRGPQSVVTGPSPEDLVDAHAAPGTGELFRSFVHEISYWDDVRIKVGKAAQDRWRRIFFHRVGSPYGAFCRIFPARAAVRFRLDLADVPFARAAEAVNVQDPYRLRLYLRSQDDVAEALALARRAWDAAVPEPEE